MGETISTEKPRSIAESLEQRACGPAVYFLQNEEALFHNAFFCLLKKKPCFKLAFKKGTWREISNN